MASTARIDELQKKFDENPRRYFATLANEYRKSGQIDRAIALCREHLPKQPGHMSGHIVYGQALYEAGDQGEARRVFQAALDLDPENVIALRHMGDIDRAGGHVEEAHRWYTRVLDADPRNAEVIALLDGLGDVRSVEPAPSRAAAELDEPAWTPPAEAAEPEPSVLHPEEFDPGPTPTIEAVEINSDLAAVPRSDEPGADARGDDAFYYPDADDAAIGAAAVANDDRGHDASTFATEPPPADHSFGDASFGDASLTDQSLLTSTVEDSLAPAERADDAPAAIEARDDAAFIGSSESTLTLLDPSAQGSELETGREVEPVAGWQ